MKTNVWDRIEEIKRVSQLDVDLRDKILLLSESLGLSKNELYMIVAHADMARRNFFAELIDQQLEDHNGYS